ARVDRPLVPSRLTEATTRRGGRRRWVMVGGAALAATLAGAAAVGLRWQLPSWPGTQEPQQAVESVVAPPIAAAPAAAQPALEFLGRGLDPAAVGQPGLDTAAIGAGTNALTIDLAGVGANTASTEVPRTNGGVEGTTGEVASGGSGATILVAPAPNRSGNAAEEASAASGVTEAEVRGAAGRSTEVVAGGPTAGTTAGAPSAGAATGAPTAAQPSEARNTAPPPPILPLDDRPSRLAAGGLHSCAILGGGAVACWGGNER